MTARPELSGRRVRLVPVGPEHRARLREIHLERKVRRWWQDPHDHFPDLGGGTNYTVLLDGEVIGFAQWYAENDPMFRHAGLARDPAGIWKDGLPMDRLEEDFVRG